MSTEKLAQLTDQELLLESKKSKSTRMYDALLIGVLFGIAIYSAFRNGVGLFSFIPLIYIPIAARNNVKSTAIENLLKERGLKA